METLNNYLSNYSPTQFNQSQLIFPKNQNIPTITPRVDNKSKNVNYNWGKNITTTKNNNLSQTQNTLQKSTNKTVLAKQISGYVPLNGDVVEIKNPKHKYGHTATYYNGTWYSDFKLRNMDPYSNSKDSTYRIFRNPNLQEAEMGALLVAAKARGKSSGYCARYVREGFNRTAKGKYNGEGYNGENFGDYLKTRGWTLVARNGMRIPKAESGITILPYAAEYIPIIHEITTPKITDNSSTYYDLPDRPSKEQMTAETKLPEQPNYNWGESMGISLETSNPKPTYNLNAYRELTSLIKLVEGGWSNNKADRGGKTNKGVTLSTFRLIFGKDKTEQDLRNITDEQWDTVFRKAAWEPSGAGKVNNKSIAKLIADWTWGSGTTGIKKIQKALGVKETGVVGNETINALNSGNARDIFNKLWNARKSHFIGITLANPSLKVFLKGWLNRLNKFTYE